MRLSTQWNIGPRGEKLGLNYQSLQVLLDEFDIGDRKDCFTRVQDFEQEFLTLLREKNTTP